MKAVVFFAVYLGLGLLITRASDLRKENDAKRLAVMITLAWPLPILIGLLMILSKTVAKLYLRIVRLDL